MPLNFNRALGYIMLGTVIGIAFVVGICRTVDAWNVGSQ